MLCKLVAASVEAADHYVTSINFQCLFLPTKKKKKREREISSHDGKASIQRKKACDDGNLHGTGS